MAEKVMKLKPKEKFYAKFLKFTFDYPKVDAAGKPVVQMNPHTGQPLYDSLGNVKPIHLTESFQILNPIFAKGYLSYAEFDPNTTDAQEIVRGEVLRKLSKERDILVFTEEDYIQLTNPQQANERKARKALEEENAALKSQLEESAFTIAELEEKATAIEKKK